MSGEDREGSVQVNCTLSVCVPLVVRQSHKEKVGSSCHLVSSHPCKRNETLKRRIQQVFFKDLDTNAFCSRAPSLGKLEAFSQQTQLHNFLSSIAQRFESPDLVYFYGNAPFAAREAMKDFCFPVKVSVPTWARADSWLRARLPAHTARESPGSSLGMVGLDRNLRTIHVIMD